MYTNSGYLNRSKAPLQDGSSPLIVSGCGTCCLYQKDKSITFRPNGRPDYQLIYVASGTSYFYFHGQPREVSAGHMVLFLPGQAQHYEYFCKDKPEVYWVHFTGGDVPNILKDYGFAPEEPILSSGTSSAYSYLFKEMIDELQGCRTGYRELLQMNLRRLFLLVQRSREERKPAVTSNILEEMEYARRYFHEHYHEPINIAQFAKSRGMSVSWFLRNFKQVTSLSPMQYILATRINNAASLLQSTDYQVTEISAIVGYDNPLYFSRIFRKQKGMSPSAFRKKMRFEEEHI